MPKGICTFSEKKKITIIITNEGYFMLMQPRSAIFNLSSFIQIAPLLLVNCFHKEIYLNKTLFMKKYVTFPVVEVPL